MFSDSMSGARDDRPGLADLMAYVREGETVVVWKLHRLCRTPSTSLKRGRHIAVVWVVDIKPGGVRTHTRWRPCGSTPRVWRRCARYGVRLCAG
jgi:Resolvase, N terminal domain